MSTDKFFLIVDPYFFIYPEHEDMPLNTRLVVQFIDNLSDWAKLFKKPNCNIGISADCIEIVKHHRRSILNKQFLEEMSKFMKRLSGTIAQVIVPMVAEVKKQLNLAEAMNTLDPEQIDYDIESTTITPPEFKTRLPADSQESFATMMGHLTFARNQKIFPVTAFENINFLTHTLGGASWIKDMLTTQIQVSYFHEEAEGISNNIEDSYSIIESASQFQEEIQDAPKRQRLKDIVMGINSKYPDKILVAQELVHELEKDYNVLSKNQTTSDSIEALTYWLQVYIEERKRHKESETIELARQAYRKLVSHDVKDASISVKQIPKLRKQRLVHFDGQEYFAFLHIQVVPRIYFTQIPYQGSYAILLGVITPHLDTALY